MEIMIRWYSNFGLKEGPKHAFQFFLVVFKQRENKHKHKLMFFFSL